MFSSRPTKRKSFEISWFSLPRINVSGIYRAIHIYTYTPANRIAETVILLDTPWWNALVYVSY